jgi:signal peptidase II
MRVLYVSLSLLVLDQLSKFAVRGFSIPFLGISHEGMSYGSSVPLFGDWFKITFIENPTMAFSLPFGGEGYQKLFLTLFALAAAVGLIAYLYRHRTAPRLMRLAIALIVAGALGNLIDRVFYGVIFGYAGYFQGNVVDFVHFDLFTVHFGNGGFKFWPIFNVADCAVSVGVLLMLFAVRPHRERAAAATVAPASATASPEPSPGQ